MTNSNSYFLIQVNHPETTTADSLQEMITDYQIGGIKATVIDRRLAGDNDLTDFFPYIAS